MKELDAEWVRKRLREAEQLSKYTDDVGRYFAGAAHAYHEILTMLTIGKMERERKVSGVREIHTDTQKVEEEAG